MTRQNTKWNWFKHL